MMAYDDGREEPEPEPPIPSSSIGHKDALRAKFAQDTADYLAHGGKISQATTSGIGNEAIRFMINADREENDRRNAEAEASRARGNRRSVAAMKAKKGK